MTTTTHTAAKTTTRTNVDTRTEVSRGALVSVTAAGAVVGLWAFASLASAMVMTGGPVALAKAWFSAVSGM